MLRILDVKFKENKLKYFGQTILGGLAVASALLLFDVVHQPAIIASFGASAFIAFTMPKQRISGPKYLIGGYFIGVAVGCLVHFVTNLPVEIYLAQKLVYTLAGGMAVALAMFLMAITNTEHAPATGIALGFVINVWTGHTIIMVMAGITVIAFIQWLMRGWMMDLI